MIRSFSLKILILVILIIYSKFTIAEIPILKSLLPDFSMVYKEGKSWEPSNFLNQGSALGLEKDTFMIPPNMNDAIKFWISVYTEHNSNQGLIHDIDNLDIVYEKVDFEFINTNSTLTENQKAKARENLIEERKKVILESLKKLAVGMAEEELSDLDKIIKGLWEKRRGLSEIKSAANLDRLRFQLGQSDRMKEAIFLSGRYLPMMEEIFRNEGLPIQLTRIAFVESSFNVLARSKVGASGLWQIMPSAARGRLKMNHVVDLRNHPQKATELAAKMLKFNFEMLGSWPLAVTGYNHGPYGVKRLVERNKTRDLGELIETGEGRRFGFASRNFYASFLAALEVEGKASGYFPGIKQDIPFQFTQFKPKQSFYFRDLVEAFNGDRELAQIYNPHLQRSAYQNKVALDNKSYLIVPLEKMEHANKVLKDALASSDSTYNSDTKNVMDKVSETKELKTNEKETNKLEIAEISNSNKNKRKKRNQVSRASERLLASDSVNEPRTYKVNRGDTLYRISRQFGVSIKSILSLNDLKRPRIMAGQVLLLP